MELSQKAIDLLSLKGKMSQASRMAEESATELENKFDYENAITMYEKAGRLYELGQLTSKGDQMMIKSCELRINDR